MTPYEALGESLLEITQCGAEHSALRDVMDPDLIHTVMTFIANCVKAKTPIEQIVLTAMAVGISIGRKVPVVEN